MRILLFLMHGSFSLECLKVLAEADTEICGIVLPKISSHTGKEIPVYVKKPVLEIAQEMNIPVYEINGTKNPALVKMLAKLKPQYILVACFPFLIPRSIRDLAWHGAYNLHPSMLPDYKGPTPLFWQFYYGESNTGITLHEMTDEIDSGPIISQTPISFPDAFSSDEASIILAREGGNLVKQHIFKITNHKIIEKKRNIGGQYFKWPTQNDFTLDTNWTVKRVYNFIKGTSHWAQPYRLIIENRLIEIVDAISYSDKSYSNGHIENEESLGINFIDGSVLLEKY